MEEKKVLQTLLDKQKKKGLGWGNNTGNNFGSCGHLFDNFWESRYSNR